MTLNEIKQAVANGIEVYWSNLNYEVRKDTKGQYLIVCKSNGTAIGLTWADRITMNGKEKDFFFT